ncbi:hypothetical protein, partial [uncultured Dialister sp.]|uniref:hypothetical protein n=1 Tax=uncultured Dialister sp. TaxID=278064 RepID=UPI0026DC65A2
SYLYSEGKINLHTNLDLTRARPSLEGKYHYTETVSLKPTLLAPVISTGGRKGGGAAVGTQKAALPDLCAATTIPHS